MLLNLDVKEVDQIMSYLMKDKWHKANPLIQKIMTQANDAKMQASTLTPPKEPKK